MISMKDKISHMASLLLSSQKLQEMAEQEQLRKQDEDTKARIACLADMAQAHAAVRALEDEIESAQRDLNRIRQEFKPVEDAAVTRLLLLEEGMRDAQSLYSRKAFELGEKHGEGQLRSALYRLHQLKAEKQAVRAAVEHARYTLTPWGRGL